MKKLLAAFCMITFHLIRAQVTGLSGWNIYLDPGHSQTENMGVNGYSEAEEVLRVGLELKELLLSTTDIDTVYISRTNDQQQVSLSQRTDHANSLGADWYHSIHSNAGPSDHNNTLMLWGQLNNGNPDPPVGGEAMSAIMIDLLTRGMRIPTIGSWGDCSFYTWSTFCESSGGPYLWVNRHTTMPSELSEEGHHTNPPQNQLYMNTEYKKLLAYLFYWSILDYHEIERPDVNILAGVITDYESGLPINSALASTGSNSYITDSYSSLFSNYSSDPEQLRNGFYYFENLETDSITLTVSSEYYYPETLEISISDTFITFADIELISNVAPMVEDSDPVNGDTLFPAWNPIIIQFSRMMDTATVHANFQMSPSVTGSFSWDSNLKILSFDPSELEAITDYTLTISDSSKDNYGHGLDGDGDGQEGGDFTINFRTGPPDMLPPQISYVYPPNTSNLIELRPIINISFDEIVSADESLENIYLLEKFENHSDVSGQFFHFIVHNKSVFNFFPTDELESSKVYVSKIGAGLYDTFGNEMVHGDAFSFMTGSDSETVWAIDDFETELSQNWWSPEQSGSTTGIIADSTSMTETSLYVNHLTESAKSMRINYGWDTTASQWLIREYLASGNPRDVIFSNDQVLEMFVFGDGSGTLFRFCVDDNVPQSASQNHEVSPWFPIDWIGWKRIRWNMSDGTTGSWIGDGQLDGNLRFDSIQLSYVNGSHQFGNVIMDDLRIIEHQELQIDDNPSFITQELTLNQNFPNPFNNSTVISYSIPIPVDVTLSIYDLQGRLISNLDAGYKAAGTHSISWHGETWKGISVPSGFYIYTLNAGDKRESKKLLLLK